MRKTEDRTTIMALKEKPALLLLTLLSIAFASKSAAEGLERTDPPAARELFAFDHDWKRFPPKTPPPADWTSQSYDDSDWIDAPGIVARLSNRNIFNRYAFELYPGLEWNGKLPRGDETVYLRSTFHFDGDLPEEAQLVLDHLIKDGGVIYLNGTEIGRTANMPKSDPAGHDSRAIVHSRIRIESGFHVDPALLQKGLNTLAISLHAYRGDDDPSDRVAAVRLTLAEGWDTRPLNAAPQHVRVLWLENPQGQAVVSWTTAIPSESNELSYDTRPHRGRLDDYAHRRPSDRSGSFTLKPEDIGFGIRPGHYHHAILSGLEPDTTYYFVAASDGETSREFHFRTAPDEDRPIKLLFGGDSRIAGMDPYLHHDRRSMNRRMASLLERHPDIIAFVHGGDFAQLAQWRFLRPWLTDHELTVAQNGRILPIVVVRGNHDTDVGFEEAFWWPGQESLYYYEIAFTPSISLIVLNTEISHGGAQRQFLRETLQRVRPDRRWIMAAYHRPAWPSVRGFESGVAPRRFWVPLFDEHRIDLALESHDHALKRTLPILNGEPHRDGVVYIGDGGLGVPQREPDATRWYLQAPGAAMASHHVHILSIEQDAIEGRAFNEGGKVIDAFAIQRRDPGDDYNRIRQDAETASPVASP